jgi:hypothetical protein
MISPAPQIEVMVYVPCPLSLIHESRKTIAKQRHVSNPEKIPNPFFVSLSILCTFLALV